MEIMHTLEKRFNLSLFQKVCVYGCVCEREKERKGGLDGNG